MPGRHGAMKLIAPEEGFEIHVDEWARGERRLVSWWREGAMIGEGCAQWLWAKTGRDDAWHPLAAHLVDTALVAERLWTDWLAPSTKRWLSEPFSDERLAGAFFALLAGCHDLGKASPAFQVQVDRLADHVRRAGVDLPRRLPMRHKAPHALVSAATIGPLLAEQGWDLDGTDGVAAILGGHHGWFPQHGYRLEVRRRPDLYGWSRSGEDPWTKARRHLFDLVLDVAGARDAVREAATASLGSARALTLSGYVTLADWIASNESIFPHLSEPFRDTYLELARERSAHALERIGWHGARAGPARAEGWFEERFGFPPNRLQDEAVKVAGQAGVGLLLIEAPMGIGKTEAALAAAEVLMRREGLGGVFLGLPTQATSNQMFGRVRRWLERLGPGTFVLELAHGRARQVGAYRELAEHGAPSCVDLDGDPHAVVTAEAWFGGPKRRLLAPYVVGTVDQALMCAAKVRHVALRQVGLAGKVVIVDEVHAYDAYTSVFLRRALRWLGEERAPVVLLSATLPPAARRRLVEAYVGRRVDLGHVPYPSVTAVSLQGAAVTSRVATSRPPVEVLVDHCEEDGGDSTFSALSELVVNMANAGADVLVIRNTVARAQRTYLAIAGRLQEGRTHLLHSRFRSGDRLEKEDRLVASFGPGADRPAGQVVVGTQVLEQSLDLDFDVLVTDLAPIDLVLQRLGRVHRHVAVERPAGFEEPRLVLAGWHSTPNGAPSFPSGSTGVYGEHLLLRSAAVLLDRRTLGLPDDVAELVAEVYGDADVAPRSWSERARVLEEEWMAEESGRERRAEEYAVAEPERAGDLLELCRLGIGDPGEDDDPAVQAAVRDSAPSVEVVIGFACASPDLVRCGPVEVSLERVPGPEEVDAVLSSALLLPSFLTKAALELAVPTGWQDHPWLGRLRLLVLNNDGEGAVGKRRVRYDGTTGLEVARGHGD